MLCSKKQQSSKNPVAMTVVETTVGLAMASTVYGEKEIKSGNAVQQHREMTATARAQSKRSVKVNI